MPNGAAGYYLLGRICSLTNRHDAAVQYHVSALILDPLLWAAYEELCALGAPRHLSNHCLLGAAFLYTIMPGPLLAPLCSSRSMLPACLLLSIGSANST